MADDTDLASVLAAVLSTAQRHNFGTATTTNAKSSTTTSSDTTKTPNAIELPSACKMKILSYLAPQQKEKVLKASADDFLPPVKFKIDELKHEELSTFSITDLETLDSVGYLIKDNFLGLQLAKQIRQEAETLRSKGSFREARMGSSSSSSSPSPSPSSTSTTGEWNDRTVRGDEIMWINNENVGAECQGISALLMRLKLLQDELNDACRFDSHKTQTHIACYPGGGTRYVRHLDASVHGSTRRLTLLYYMNEGWKQGDGGELRIYLKDKTKENSDAETHVDVAPLLDRLLVFQSRMLEHEVLPSNIVRFALTVWFY